MSLEPTRGRNLGVRVVQPEAIGRIQIATRLYWSFVRGVQGCSSWIGGWLRNSFSKDDVPTAADGDTT